MAGSNRLMTHEISPACQAERTRAAGLTSHLVDRLIEVGPNGWPFRDDFEAMVRLLCILARTIREGGTTKDLDAVIAREFGTH